MSTVERGMQSKDRYFFLITTEQLKHAYPHVWHCRADTFWAIYLVYGIVHTSKRSSDQAPQILPRGDRGQDTLILCDLHNPISDLAALCLRETTTSARVFAGWDLYDLYDMYNLYDLYDLCDMRGLYDTSYYTAYHNSKGVHYLDYLQQ